MTRTKKTGFTLVELLVVISIIGILIGILIPAVGAVNRRAAEFSIQNDVNNLNMALEQFKTKMGFFPPDFSEINSAQDFLPYLNKISRNHAEGNGAPGTGLAIWWDEVGQHLGPDTALTFWLTGLANDSQFPLTYNDGAQRRGLPAYNVAPVDTGGNFINIERKSMIDLSDGQLTTYIAGPNGQDMIASYDQARGADKLAFVYFSAGAYDTTAYASFMTRDGGFVVRPYYDDNGTAGVTTDDTVPENAVDRFQILSAGVDGKYGNTGSISALIPADRDNVCSFSDGRVERMFLGQ